MVKHTRTIERDDEGEFTYFCSCRTVYVSRLGSYQEAVNLDKAHKAAVADGSWQAEWDAETARIQAAAPLNAAKKAAYDAKDDARSAGFAYIIAKQNGGDVEAAKAELDAARQTLADAEAALALMLAKEQS